MQQLPGEILANITQRLKTCDILRIYKSGDSRLNWTLAHGGGITHLKMLFNHRWCYYEKCFYTHFTSLKSIKMKMYWDKKLETSIIIGTIPKCVERLQVESWYLESALSNVYFPNLQECKFINTSESLIEDFLTLSNVFSSTLTSVKLYGFNKAVTSLLPSTVTNLKSHNNVGRISLLPNPLVYSFLATLDKLKCDNGIWLALEKICQLQPVLPMRKLSLANVGFCVPEASFIKVIQCCPNLEYLDTMYHDSFLLTLDIAKSLPASLLRLTWFCKQNNQLVEIVASLPRSINELVLMPIIYESFDNRQELSKALPPSLTRMDNELCDMIKVDDNNLQYIFQNQRQLLELDYLLNCEIFPILPRTLTKLSVVAGDREGNWPLPSTLTDLTLNCTTYFLLDCLNHNKNSLTALKRLRFCGSGLVEAKGLLALLPQSLTECRIDHIYTFTFNLDGNFLAQCSLKNLSLECHSLDSTVLNSLPRTLQRLNLVIREWNETLLKFDWLAPLSNLIHLTIGEFYSSIGESQRQQLPRGLSTLEFLFSNEKYLTESKVVLSQGLPPHLCNIQMNVLVD